MGRHTQHRLITTVAEEELPDGTLTTRYRFSHALYQDQSARIAASLAVHFERGRDFERAVDYLITAADNATHAYANTEADALYSHALALVDRLDGAVQAKTQITILGKRAETRLTRSQFSGAAEDFSPLVEQARSLDDAASEFSGLTSLTQALFFSHRLDETAERAGQALAGAERGKNAAWQADVLNLVGLKQLCYGELKDAKQSLDNAIALARRWDIHRRWPLG